MRFALGSRSALRFCRGALPSVHARPCDSVGAVCARCAPVFAILSGRFALGSRAALRFCRGGLPSVCARPCGSVGAVCPRFARGLAILSGRFDLGLRAALRLCRGGLPRFTPAVCLTTNRTACGILRSYSAGSRSPFVRSRCVSAIIGRSGFTSGLCVSLWRSRRVTGVRETGLAARPLCVFAQSHWLCCSFRGEYAGAARPKPAPKSLRLSGLSSRCGGVGLVRIRAVTRAHGKTRPALIYGRPGRAVQRCYLHAQSSRLEPPPSGAESG